MQVKVLKFGGSSLADAEQFKKVAAIVRAEPERRYVVASAPGKRFSGDVKVTDMLYGCFDLATEKKDIGEAFAKIEARYNEIIRDLGLDFSLDEEFSNIRMSIQHYAGKDYVASRGEYLNSMILAKYLGFPFVDAERGVFFTEDGKFDDKKTYAVLSDILSKYDRAVIPGFYGSMPNGTIKTFSRGGSDITGSIVARAVNASLYENWTDVSGMLMADPRCIKDPLVIPEITYQELRELAYMGATVMHEEAIFPVREACIPINIRNTNAPADPGTMIVPTADSMPMGTVITGVAGRKGFSTITIEKDRMNTEVGFGRKVLSVLEDFSVSFEHIPSGIDAMSVVVSTAALQDNRDAIISGIFRDAKPDTVTIEDHLALIAIVGRGMVKAKGTAGRVFTACAEAGINIRMIDQGSGENNIIVGVSEDDYAGTLHAIYHEFVKGTIHAV
jgi:aspartate kinase